MQAEIYSELEKHLSEASRVVRLKGGDPFIFGRGFEEKKYVEDLGYQVEVIPGLSSSVGLATLIGLPLTHRNISSGFAVITGHGCANKEIEFANYANVETIVVLMGVKNRVKICSGLIEHGRSEKESVAFIENGSLENQKIVFSSLGQVAKGELEVLNPAVYVIGDVVKLLEKND